MDADDVALACLSCRPVPQGTRPEGERIESVEFLYGVASILGQFGTLLRERGKEFRNSDEGRQLEQQVESFYAQLDVQQRHVVDLVLTSLEQLVKAVQECDRNLQTANKPGNGPQANMNGRGRALGNRPPSLKRPVPVAAPVMQRREGQ